jgi:hypothetical protein
MGYRLAMQTLPIHPQPRPGESLTSWVSRLAAANCSTLSDILTPLIGRDGWRKKDLDLVDPLTLSKLSQIGNVRDETSLRLMVLSSCIDLLLGQNSSDRKSWVSSTQVVRFCPACLSEDEDPYFRLLWRLHLLPICPVHKILILEIKRAEFSYKASQAISVKIEQEKFSRLMIFVSSLKSILETERVSILGFNFNAKELLASLRFLLRYFNLFLTRESHWEIALQSQGLAVVRPFHWRENSAVAALFLEESLRLLEDWPNRFRQFVRKNDTRLKRLVRELDSHGLEDGLKSIEKEILDSPVNESDCKGRISAWDLRRCYSKENLDVESAVKTLKERGISVSENSVSLYLGRSSFYVRKYHMLESL